MVPLRPLAPFDLLSKSIKFFVIIIRHLSEAIGSWGIANVPATETFMLSAYVY